MSCRTHVLTKPAGPYIVIQPKPRISEEMKNGHCIPVAKNRLPGMRVRTTTTAMGTAMSRVSTVVPNAKSAVFTMTWPKPASVNRRPKFWTVKTPPSSKSGRSRKAWISVGTTGASTRSARKPRTSQCTHDSRAPPRKRR